MSLSRRGFLGAALAAAVAPAIIRTPGILMPIRPGLVVVDQMPTGDEYLDGLMRRIRSHLIERAIRPPIVLNEKTSAAYAADVARGFDLSPGAVNSVRFRHPDLVALDTARAQLVAAESHSVLLPGLRPIA